MKLTDLKGWKKLSEAEKNRLTEVYGKDAEITKTMHDTKRSSLKKAKEAANA